MHGTNDARSRPGRRGRCRCRSAGAGRALEVLDGEGAERLVLGVFVAAAGNAGAAIGGGAIIVIGLVIAVAGAVFAGATRGVFGVALYRYVAEDQALGPFTVQDLEGAARTR